MKKITLVLLIVLACVALLFACSKRKSTVAPMKDPASDTPRAEVGLTDEEADDGTSPEVEQSPTGNDESLFYTLTVAQTGEGVVSLSHERAKEGEEVEIIAAPKDKWTISSVRVNGETIESKVFRMPSKNTEISVVFRNKMHRIICDGSVAIAGAQRVEGEAAPVYEIEEGVTYSLLVSFADPNGYYEDSDVRCTYRSGEKLIEMPLEKEGDGKYAFVAPGADVAATLTAHTYRRIRSVSVVILSDQGEEEITDHCELSLLCNGAFYALGDDVKEDVVFRVRVLAPSPYHLTSFDGEKAFLTLENGVGTFYAADCAEDLRLELRAR